jgi:di/tricarboxylate transporter
MLDPQIPGNVKFDEVKWAGIGCGFVLLCTSPALIWRAILPLFEGAFLQITREASSMNPQFWLYWIGVVTLVYIILLPGVIFLVMKRAQQRQVT